MKQLGFLVILLICTDIQADDETCDVWTIECPDIMLASTQTHKKPPLSPVPRGKEWVVFASQPKQELTDNDRIGRTGMVITVVIGLLMFFISPNKH